MELLHQLREDFREFSDSCLGIVLYGSYAKGEETVRSGIDVCIVKPEKDLLDKKTEGKYDIKVFEKLSLLHQKRNYI